VQLVVPQKGSRRDLLRLQHTADAGKLLRIEQWLERLLAREGENALNQVRDEARALAGELHLESQFKHLDRVIAALLGYDPASVELFQSLAKHLNDRPPMIAEEQPGIDRTLQAFVESYFSNYIEGKGTPFELTEAHRIVVTDRPLQDREDDSHDILGTFNSILDSRARADQALDFDAFLRQLRSWNRQVTFSRSERGAGRLKSKPNRVGAYRFVAPELVAGTLRKGWELIAAASVPSVRAALSLFVVLEVHPFPDGNGRTARLAMNLALSAAGLTRIIVPTVFRKDYLLALQRLRNVNPEPYVRMLRQAAAFSRWLDCGSQAKCFAQLRESNALAEPKEGGLRLPQPQQPLRARASS